MTKGDACIVRITGGCGFMNSAEEERMMSFAQAFDDYKGVVIGGGTRMIMKDDLSKIRPGVTELLPAIKKISPAAITVGLVPKVEGNSMGFLPDGRIAFDSSDKADYYTIMAHENDVSILVQKSVDKGIKWEDEYRACIHTMHILKTEKQYRTLTFFYNGGMISEMELLDTVKLGWPVVLVRNSGRMCDKFCNDSLFLIEHPNVFIVDTASDLKKVLETQFKKQIKFEKAWTKQTTT